MTIVVAIVVTIVVAILTIRHFSNVYHVLYIYYIYYLCVIVPSIVHTTFIERNDKFQHLLKRLDRSNINISNQRYNLTSINQK